MRLQSLMLTIVLFLLCASGMQAAQKPDDREALSGLAATKVIFDVRFADLDKLVANLSLFNETFDGMVGQGIKPEMIIAFRGPGVKLLLSSELHEEALDLIRTLKEKGVRIEVCAVAMRIYKADPAGLAPELKLVANIFNSLIGYQHKGYAMIAVN